MKKKMKIQFDLLLEYDSNQFTVAELEAMIVAAFRVEDSINDVELFLPEIEPSEAGSGVRVLEYWEFAAVTWGDEEPGPGTHGSYCLILDDDEQSIIWDTPELAALIAEKKIALFDYELWLMEGDIETYSILSEYGVIE